MEWIEEEGRTSEKALKKALKRMKATRDEVRVEILEENKGMMAYLSDKTIKIRVSLLGSEGRGAQSVQIQPDSSDSPREQPPIGRDCLKDAKDVVAGILDRMEIACTVGGTSRENEINLNIFSDKGGLIIGKRGETIDALQHVVSKMLNKGGQEKLKIMLDVENYRARRKERIKNLAESLAARVKETGRPATLEEMSSQDRKVIHMALQGDERIQTESRGNGVLKKVVISLKEKHPENS